MSTFQVAVVDQRQKDLKAPESPQNLIAPWLRLLATLNNDRAIIGTSKTMSQRFLVGSRVVPPLSILESGEFENRNGLHPGPFDHKMTPPVRPDSHRIALGRSLGFGRIHRKLRRITRALFTTTT
jgi:hypothetical protein